MMERRLSWCWCIILFVFCIFVSAYFQLEIETQPRSNSVYIVLQCWVKVTQIVERACKFPSNYRKKKNYLPLSIMKISAVDKIKLWKYLLLNAAIYILYRMGWEFVSLKSKPQSNSKNAWNCNIKEIINFFPFE